MTINDKLEIKLRKFFNVPLAQLTERGEHFEIFLYTFSFAMRTFFLESRGSTVLVTCLFFV